MLSTLNISLSGKHGRPILTDVYNMITSHPKPVVIFAHGFKGFKDWGHWHLFAKAFVQNDAVFVKFNFSHNGTTLDAPLDFDDLEAFGQNNFTKEYDDLGTVLDFVTGDHFPVHSTEVDLSRIILIGHSRGGPICLTRLANDSRIAAAITWASVSRLDYAWEGPDFIQQWQEKGVYHVVNGRTGQEMPLYWQLFEDFEKNRSLFDLNKQLTDCTKPICIIHGDADPAVPISAATELDAICPNSQVHIIPGGDHVFGGKHPYEQDQLPPASADVFHKSLDFLKQV